MEVRAVAKWIHRGPRKLRKYVDLIRNVSIEEAQAILGVQISPAAAEVLKCLNSAVANAENNHGLDPDELVVRHAAVSQGLRMPRLRPRARGRADRYYRKTSHITIVVGDEDDTAVSD